MTDSFRRVDLRFYHRNHPPNLSWYGRVAIINNRINEISDQWRMQINIRRMPLISLPLPRHNSHRAFVQDRNMNRTMQAKDVERVLRLARGVRNGKNGTGSAGELKQCCGRVFDFPCEQDICGQRSCLGDLPEDVREYFDAMAAEIKHRPSAGSLLPQKPGARVLGAGVERLECVHLREDWRTDFSGLDDVPGAFNDWIKMAVIGDAEFHPVGLCRSNHSIAFGRIHRHWLFAQHMFPGFGRGNRLRSM